MSARHGAHANCVHLLDRMKKYIYEQKDYELMIFLRNMGEKRGWYSISAHATSEVKTIFR